MKTRSFGTFSPGEEDMSAYPDDQLVLEALDDSHQAFEQLVKQYQYRVLRTIASIVSDEQATQDVAQETFLSAWSNLAKLKERHKFGRWLSQTAVNLSKRWLRDQRRYQENATSFMDMLSLTQERQYQRDRLRYEIWEAIDELSEDYREAVILHYISGYSYREIGEMLSVPVSTVSGRLQKAKNQLRKEFLDMVTQLQLEIDSTVHKFLKERAKQHDLSIEALIVRLIERYKRDIDKPHVSVRQVWESSREPLMSDDCGAPSPDGRYLSFTEWYSANLAVRDLITGECRILTDEGTWDGPDQWAGQSVWSPDSKQIAYAWCNEDCWELRIVGLDGSEPRVLYRNKNKEVKRIQPHAWSRDGKSILAWFGKIPGPSTSEIVLISVADGSVRVLKSGQYLPTKMDISPDGRYIVYEHSIDVYSPRDIFLLATDGSEEEISLVEHPANDYGPVWAPDGKSIVFVSDRSGTYGAWLMQVVDGKPAGEPQLVKRDMGAMQPMGFTGEGSLYYSLSAGLEDVYVVSLDPSTGEVLAPPAKVSHRFEGFNSSPAWSPDGKYLAYQSKRWPVPGGAAGHRVLVIRSVETGEERVFPAQGAFLYRMRWSPDGRSILCEATENREFHFTLIDTQTGDVTFIVPRDAEGRTRDCEWRPDGKAIFCIKGPQYSMIIVMHDLETGKEKELWQEGAHWVGLGISPDGRQLVFGKDKALMVMAVEGGEPRILHRLQEGEFAFYSSPKWTADGRYVLFGKRNPNELWRVPVEGGEAQKLLEMDGLRSISVHPDGQRIAFTGGGQNISEVWVMENFLPGFTANK